MSLWSLLKGYYEIEAVGNNARLLNVIKARNINVWGIRKTADDKMVFKVGLLGYKKITELKEYYKIEVIKEVGVPSFFKKHKKRWGFLIGAAIFVSGLFFMNSFIWNINVYGVENLSEQEILKELALKNIKIGETVYNIDKVKAELEIQIKYPQIKWLQIETKGTTVNVYLKESSQKSEERVPEEEPCDIVAKKDGVIKFAAAYNGIPVVEAGQSVSKGDILIKGEYLTEMQNERKVHASGVVMAETVNVIEVKVPLKFEEPELTGGVFKRQTLRIFSWEIKLYNEKDEIPFKAFESKQEKKQLKIFGEISFPVFFISNEFYEVMPQTVLIGEETALKKAENIANKLQMEQFGGIIVEEELSDYKIKDGVLYYERVLYCKEDIATEKRQEK